VIDKQNRKTALDHTQSFIVQAPAGSGKTELLTQRYLKLLAVSTSPESVVVMTFTKKAASELVDRVVGALKLAQGERPDNNDHRQVTYDLALDVLNRSNASNWDIANNPSRLKVTTIDGLSSLIINRYPYKQQLIPKGILSSSWEAQDFYQQASEQALLLIHDKDYTEVISRVLLYLDNNVNKYYSLIINMLAKRDQWLSRLYQNGVIDIDQLQSNSIRVINVHLQKLKTAASESFPQEMFDLLSANTEKKYQTLSSIPNADVDSLESWINLKELLLTNQNNWRKTLDKRNGFPSSVKEQKQEFLSIVNKIKNDNLLDLFVELDYLPDKEFSNTQISILEDISFVLKLAVAQLKILFDKENKHDFIQVALDALHAIDNRGDKVSDIALFLDYKIEHILIDEFQDTSISQFLLLERLVENWDENNGKTLFLVGDPMQSIYRFRESKVGLFLQAIKHGVAGVGLNYLRLSSNFRSSSSVIEANNNLFNTVFPSVEDITRGAISFNESKPPKADKNLYDAITYYAVEYKRYDLEAQKVVEIISADSTSESIAIIARGRAHLNEIARELKLNNIEFEALRITPLKEHIFTRDLVSLTRALLDLGDKLAWLSLLRSPWCGLVLDDLLILSKDDGNIIFDKLNDPLILEQLSPDGQNRASKFYKILSHTIGNQSRFSFVELLDYALESLIPINSLSTQEKDIRNEYLAIVDACESNYVLNMQTINSMLDELYAPSSNARVKMLTIHEAKGLEFDSVIIPGLGRAPRQNKAQLIHLHEFEDKSLLLAPTKSFKDLEDSATYKYLKRIESVQDDYELMRLLYVAMTRAKKNIHLLSCAPKGENANNKSLLNLLMCKFRCLFKDIDNTSSKLLPTSETPNISRRDALDSCNEFVDNNTESLDYQNLINTTYKSLLGTLLHKICEHKEFSVGKNSIKTRLIEFGFAQSELSTNIEIIYHLINNTKTDEKFNWLFKARESTLTEVEFASETGNIVIDRLFIDDDVLWIIDFKTASRQAGETLDQFSIRQKAKYAKQLNLYRQTLSQIYSNAINCALYCPAEQELIRIEP